jgi:hypothetical protein
MSETVVETRDDALNGMFPGMEPVIAAPDGPGGVIEQIAKHIVAGEIEFPPDYYAKLPLPADWPRERCIGFGHAILDVIEPYGKNNLGYRDIETLRRFHLGPSRNRIKTLFHTLPAFQHAIGAEVVKVSNGTFSHWTTSDFARHAAEVAAIRQRRPRTYDYDAIADKDPAKPRNRILMGHGGGLRKIHALIGYPDHTDWGPEECIDWGVKIREANGRRVSRVYVHALSARERSPSTSSLMRQSDMNWGDYTEAVETAFHEQQATRSRDRTAKLTRYVRLTQNGQLPAGYKELSESELLARAAKHLLVVKCLRLRNAELAPSKIRELAELKGVFADRFCKAVLGLTAGDIELQGRPRRTG